MRIPPKPTKYKGIQFRSRLEADWAKTLDALGIQWSYEARKVVLPNGDWYLPDFFLPEQSSYLEVKGTGVPGIEKLYEFEFVETLDDPVCEGRDLYGLFIIGLPNGRFDIVNSNMPKVIECSKCYRFYFSGYYAVYPGCVFCDRPQHDSYDPVTGKYTKSKPFEYDGEECIPHWKGYVA